MPRSCAARRWMLTAPHSPIPVCSRARSAFAPRVRPCRLLRSPISYSGPFPRPGGPAPRIPAHTSQWSPPPGGRFGQSFSALALLSAFSPSAWGDAFFPSSTGSLWLAPSRIAGVTFRALAPGPRPFPAWAFFTFSRSCAPRTRAQCWAAHGLKMAVVNLVLPVKTAPRSRGAASPRVGWVLWASGSGNGRSQ